MKSVAKVLSVTRKLPAAGLALPLGELSPQVTERAHAVALSAKVLGVMRNLVATAEAVPLGKVASLQAMTEGVLLPRSRTSCRRQFNPV